MDMLVFDTLNEEAERTNIVVGSVVVHGCLVYRSKLTWSGRARPNYQLTSSSGNSAKEPISPAKTRAWSLTQRALGLTDALTRWRADHFDFQPRRLRQPGAAGVRRRERQANFQTPS